MSLHEPAWWALLKIIQLIMDERYVVIDVKGKGLVIFSSYEYPCSCTRTALIRRCSHAGVCNVIIDAMAKYDRPIHIIVGGFHLVPVEQQPVEQTVDFIFRRIQPPPAYVLPLHCTGLEPRARLKAALGSRCIPAGVGMRVTVASDVEAEEVLGNVEVSILA